MATKPIKKRGPKVLTPGKKDGRPVKYTLDWAVGEATWMLYFIKEGPIGESILFESEMCEIREYAKERWSESIKKYSTQILRTEEMTDSEFEHENSMRSQFVDLIDRIRTILHNRLLKGGLLKEFDSGMTKFVLVNHHKYKSSVSDTNLNTDLILKTTINLNE